MKAPDRKRFTGHEVHVAEERCMPSGTTSSGLNDIYCQDVLCEG